MSEIKQPEEKNETRDSLELSLMDSWSSTIARNGLESIMTDFAEVGLDAVLDDGIFKAFSIVSTIVSLYKIGHSVKERRYIQKLIQFLNELDHGKITEEKKKEYINRIKKDPHRTKKELEYVLMLIDRIISTQKVKHLAKLFLAFVNSKINWMQFCQYSEVIDRFLPGDDVFLNNNLLKNPERDKLAECAIQRLQGLGIVCPVSVPSSYNIKGEVISTKNDGTYDLTAFGEIMAKILIEENVTSICGDGTDEI